MIFQVPGQGIVLANGSIHAFREASLKGLLPLRRGSISSSIPLPRTTKRIWSITLLSRGDSTYELESDHHSPCVSLVGDPNSSLSLINCHPVLTIQEGQRQPSYITVFKFSAPISSVEPSLMLRKEKIVPLSYLVDRSQSMSMSEEGERGQGSVSKGLLLRRSRFLDL
jgi:hypothetical protein